MTTYRVIRQGPGRRPEYAYLLDDELANLTEGFCPFRDECHLGHPNPEWRDDGRLLIDSDDWAVCSQGIRWKMEPHEVVTLYPCE